MTKREQRTRAVMFAEGASVLVRLGGIEDAHVPGTVLVVGWKTGTYRVRVGRRIHHVSVSQVQKP